MQFWPRKRAARQYPRIRAFNTDEQGLLAFAGFKMGMTHVKATDSHKTSQFKNESQSIPVTILECPPMRVYSVRGYNRTAHGFNVAKEVIVGKHKHLGRKVTPRDPGALDISPDFHDIRVLLMTQPSKTGIGQKKPQIFEVQLGGSNEEKIETIKGMVGKDIKASEILQEGDYVDLHAITTGRGYQGPVKRFGIGLKASKSEKGRRRPGSLGGWSGQQHFMYRNANAGQTGYHQRVQYNNQIIKITDNPEEINPKGGFVNYGEGKKGNEFLLIKGSVPGPKKRMIALVKATRLHDKNTPPTVEEISLESKQGK